MADNTLEPNESSEIDEGSDDGELEGYVRGVLEQATTFIEQELSPDRAVATDYYMGRPFGNEEEGRSRVVSTDVRDSVMQALPSLMRVFFGPERAVEFMPRSAEDVPVAEQATEFIADIVMRVDNNGFLQLHSAFKDALIRRVGVVKYWWEQRNTVKEESFTGLDELAIQELVGDPTLELTAATQGPDGLYDVTVKRSVRDGRIRFACIPPEEFMYNPSARSLDDAIMVGHRSYMSVSQLVAMGYDEDEINESIAYGRTVMQKQEEDARNLHYTPVAEVDAAKDEQSGAQPVLYVEAYFNIQDDQTGKSELRKICTVGEGYDIVMNVPADEKPFALFLPDPEPHTIEGLSFADRTMDIQKIKSMVLRANLDSLSLTLMPATEIVEGMVNMQDVLNTEIGKVIRTKGPGMMREVDHRYVGADSFPMLQYLDDMKESRIGISKASAGLSPDVLQSTTKAAVNATVEAARMQLEMVARVFAETGFKDLMRGLLRLAVRHQQPGRVVKLRNQYVPIDPRAWDMEMDVSINVALGSALIEDKIMTLTQIAQKQEQILQMLGPENPMVSVAQYRYTLARMVELLGFKDTSKFFKEIDEQQMQEAAAAAAQAPPPPDPAMELAKAEIAKSQSDIQVAQAKLQLDIQKFQLNQQIALSERQAQQETLALQEQTEARRHTREMEKIAAEVQLKELELELKYQSSINEAKVKGDIALQTAQIDAAAKQETAKMVAEIKKPTKRSVSLERDENRRLTGMTIHEEA